MQGVWIRKPEGRTTVVFVHGILSDGERCWRNPNGTYWPDLLKQSSSLPSIGIYVFTYETGVFSGSYRLSDAVDALKEYMRLDGILDCKQIVFVCHSMGGIVVRKFIVERATELLSGGIAIGLFLVASPSLGAAYANMLAPLAKAFGHSQADALRFCQTNAWLNDLDKEFQNLKESQRIILTGKELVEDKFVVFRKLVRKQVVEPFSGAKYFGEAFKVPESDHFSIAKPADGASIQHRLLERYLIDTVAIYPNGNPTDFSTQPTAGYHYFSYAERDGESLALSIISQVESASAALSCWALTRDLGSGQDILQSIDDALLRSLSFVFLLTEGSSSDGERCVDEWKRAISYNKPITVIRLSRETPCPMPLETRQSIDFTVGREVGLVALTKRLLRLPTTMGRLESLQDHLMASRRSASYAPIASRARYKSEIDALEQQIAGLEAALSDKSAFRERVQRSLERERQTPGEAPSKPTPQYRFVNAPPLPVPRYFENRHVETSLIGDFLRDRAARILTVHGRGGVGKTALVCRVLASLENDVLPDDGGPFRVAAVVYVNATRANVNLFPKLLDGLILTLTATVRQELKPLLESESATVATKLRAIVPALSPEPTLVLLDNFEDLISVEHGCITDPEIRGLIEFLCEPSEHSLKIIITTRVLPREILDISPARHIRISLSGGLVSPHAERVLRKLDSDGSAGLRDASDGVLSRVASVTRGFPRALEAFYSIIEADPSKEIEDVVADLRNASHPDEKLTRVLVGEAYSRLLQIDQKVMECVAAYGRPVSVTGIEYLLAESAPYIDGSAALKRLVAMHFVRREGRAYYLHPIDREHSLGFLTEVEKNLLRARAADYYEEIARPRSEWKSLADIESPLEQFRLRLEAHDLSTAREILEDVASFLDKRGAFEQKLSLASALKSFATNKEDVCTALRHIASSQWRLGALADAVDTQEQLVQVLELDDQASEADLFIAKCNGAIFRMGLGPTEELLLAFQQFLVKLEDKYPWETKSIATAHANIADCLETLGYLDKALFQEQRAYELSANADPDRKEAATHNLANKHLAIGSAALAKQLFLEALAIFDESKNPLWRANHLAALASWHQAAGQLGDAMQFVERAIDARVQIGDLGGWARDVRSKAKTHLMKCELELALKAGTEALQRARDLKLPLRDYLMLCAEIYVCQGRVSDADHLLADHAKDKREPRWRVDNLLGTILIVQQNIEEARAAFDRALRQCDVWLSRFATNRKAAAGKALALAGLALCGDVEAERLVIKQYGIALSLATGSGEVSDLRRNLEQLGVGLKPKLIATIVSAAFD